MFITASEHYGAVMNLDFDYVRYLDELKANRFDLTRVKGLLAVQRTVVAKLVTELNDFDNIYFEVCNEPYERGGLTKEWNDQIIAAIADTEALLPKKHLIRQGFPPSTAVAELNSRVSILNFHAANIDSVRLNYSFNRVIAFDETGGTDRSDGKYRTEGWDWIMGGGGV